MSINWKVLFIITICCVSCNSLKVKNQYSSIPTPVEEIEEVYLFSTKDIIPTDIQLYSEIVLREDNNLNWNRNKSRLIDFAKDRNCNGIIIKDIGWSSHGNGFYIKAELFYYQNEKINSLHILNNGKAQCTITIFRDEGEPPIASGFNVDLNVNGQGYNDLMNRSFIRVKGVDCDSIAVLVNQTEYNINFNESKHLYFKLSKNAVTTYMGGTVHNSYGDFMLYEIDDLELGKLLSEQYQNYAHQDL